MNRLELWGGVECTVNRVADRYFDQLEKSGHTARLDDLDRFAALGIRTLRFPALWERIAPTALDTPDWRWTDAALDRMRALGMRPIVGFLHHGSGPAHTDLLDPGFADKLAAFAGRFAERYPWVDAYTPINEPLTTARFSGLYGHWYPHARDTTRFLTILLNECRGVIAAMRAVERVNPNRALIQTEDLGVVTSTPRLAYQAAFENERRWLALDLLRGDVDRGHRLHAWMLRNGVLREALKWFQVNARAPDVIGVNHYITSNRYLDERLAHYPAGAEGGNGRDRYADVEAIRVAAAPFVGPDALLQQTWARYRTPIAITEAHMGCTREEQMRWLMEVWTGAQAARAVGVPVSAVTAWSLLGAFDWDSLVTLDRNHYEPGAFDVRGIAPRPTALCAMLSALANDRVPDHPVLATGGWWRRDERVLYRCSSRAACWPVSQASPAASKSGEAGVHRRREILITGARGTLGQVFARVCEQRGLAYRLVDRQTLDISDPLAVEQALNAFSPWALVNAAGYCRVDEAESDRDACYRANALGPALLAQACAERRLPFVTFSSDLVFDGRARSPYHESDEVAPLCIYGLSKADAERKVLEAHAGALVVRTSAFFGPWDAYNFVTLTLQALARKERVRAATDLTVSPTYVPDLVNASLDLLIDGANGIWHLANAGATSWAELAARTADLRGYDSAMVEPVPYTVLGLTARRPAYSALASERSKGLMPPLEAALARYAIDCTLA